MTIIGPGIFGHVGWTRYGRVKEEELWKPLKPVQIMRNERRFKANFGMADDQCARLWQKLEAHSSTGLGLHGWKPKHLLDALFFLRQYTTEDVQSMITGNDVKTLRKWNWTVIEEIATMDWIDFDNRNKYDNGSICRITVDGTDFRIYEPTPFDPKWYSRHKFNGPAVRYEVGITIQTGELVWINGPYPAGEWPDLRIARDWLIYELEEGEKALADGGYNDGGEFFETPNGLNDDDQTMKQLARARHETINGRFKVWSILQQRFRHPVAKHGLVFRAVANIVHFLMEDQGLTEYERGIFGVAYYDRNAIP